MLAKTKQEKIKKFYKVVAKMQFPPAKEIGMIIVKKRRWPILPLWRPILIW